MNFIRMNHDVEIYFTMKLMDPMSLKAQEARFFDRLLLISSISKH